MRNLILILFILLSQITFGQAVKLTPGQTYTNQTTDTLYILQTKQVKELLSTVVSNEVNLEKIQLYKQKLSLMEERNFLADSAITLKKTEAIYWHEQLLKTDQQLEAQRLQNLKLIDDRNRIRQSRIYYLLAGVVASAVVINL